MKDTNYTIQTSKDNYVTYTTSKNKKMKNYEKEFMKSLIRFKDTVDEYFYKNCIVQMTKWVNTSYLGEKQQQWLKMLNEECENE